MKVCQAEDVKLPTKQAIDKKVAQMGKLVAQPMTEVSFLALGGKVCADGESGRYYRDAAS